MKKTLFAIAATLAVSTLAMADEEIKLAAAIGSGGATTSTSSSAGTIATSSAGMTAATMISVGLISAASIAVLAESGGSSSTSH